VCICDFWRDFVVHFENRRCCFKDESLVGSFNFGEMGLLYWVFNCMLSKSNQANLGIIWICCIVSMYPMEKRGKTLHPCLLLKMVWLSLVEIAAIASQA
jgi:hypothetical protein